MPRPDRGRGPALPRAAQSRSRAVFRLAALPGALGPLGEPHVLGPAVVRWRQVSPLERPLLAVVLAEREREPRLHELAAEVERVRRLVDAELREDLVDVRAPHEDLVVEDGDDFAIREDTEVRVGHAGLQLAQLDLRSEEHTSELQSQSNLVCRLLLEKKKYSIITVPHAALLLYTVL